MDNKNKIIWLMAECIRDVCDTCCPKDRFCDEYVEQLCKRDFRSKDCGNENVTCWISYFELQAGEKK